MDPTKSSSDIKVVLGDETLLFQGNVIGTPPPVTRNGNINDQMMNSGGTATSGPSNILLSFPLHLRLSYLGDTLYFSEGYPTTSDGQHLFGSLSIRRYRIATGEVDTYCGVDFSNNPFNESYFDLIGSVGGYLDAGVSSALFKYPMTIVVVPSDKELSWKFDKNNNQNDEPTFHVIYVADHTNGAIRKIHPSMYTPSPTLSPTTLHPPSLQPTFSPTLIENFEPSVSFFDELESYQQILLVTGCILFGFLICFCCLSCCFVGSDSADGLEQADLENSKTGLFYTPKKQKNIQDYVTPSWNVNLPFRQGSYQQKLSSDDGRNGLLDVSMASTTSTEENEEWEDMVWHRTPNLNISKQYRVSESKWPAKLESLMYSKGEISRGHENTPNPVWSTITPFASTQKVSFDEVSKEESAGSSSDTLSDHTNEPGTATHLPISLFTRLTQWWIPSSAVNEIQLNDAPHMVGAQRMSGDDIRKTPKTMLRKWNSSKWDQVDETVVSLQFDD